MRPLRSIYLTISRAAQIAPQHRLILSIEPMQGVHGLFDESIEMHLARISHSAELNEG